MDEKKSVNKSLVVVSLLLLMVVAVLIAVFLLRPAEEWEGIVLPAVGTEPGREPVQEHEASSGFLEINHDNIISALNSLEKPEYYHQAFSVQISSGRSNASKTVELWVNGPLIHAEIRDGRNVKFFFSDGAQVWLWYDRETDPVVVRLGEDLLLEDLLGIPNFDYQTKMAQAQRISCDYGYEEETLLQYLAICTQDRENVVSEYRFSLESGLLYSCSTRENDVSVYSVVQTAFERLAYGDQAFEGRFRLPDGSVPFTVEREMPLP